jgi:hypothetical protein
MAVYTRQAIKSVLLFSIVNLYVPQQIPRAIFPFTPQSYGLAQYARSGVVSVEISNPEGSI